MIYLLTQMILCLVLAALAGGALGWLLQRARAGRQNEALRETVSRQHHQLRHAETDVAMLTDDFDDLKQRSQTEIEALRLENRRLPTLLQNLDKSQTLVRQLMQKHETQLREAVQQSETLRARLVDHDEREAAFARARSELESARAELRTLRARQDVPDGHEPTPVVPAALASVALESVAIGPTERVGAIAERPDLALVQDASTSSIEPEPEPEPEPESESEFAFEPDGDATIAIAASDRPLFVTSAAMPASVAIDHGAPHADDADDVDDVDVLADVDALDENDPYDEELPDDDGFEEDEYDLLDESVEMLFEPVDRHDDLQRIFGIGPVTERALNRLGITSYPQLAELQRHEVEQIADALQIYPGRIERDDWVGNARRQLEDVLEEL